MNCKGQKGRADKILAPYPQSLSPLRGEARRRQGSSSQDIS